MQLDRAAIPLVPRSTAHCLDLAMRVFGRHVVEMLRIWLAVGLPAAALVWVTLSAWEWDYRVMITVAWFASLPAGVLAVSAAAPRVFGEQMHFARESPGGWEKTEASLLFAADLAAWLCLALVAADYIEERFLVRIGPPMWLVAACRWGLLIALVVRSAVYFAMRMRTNPAIGGVLAFSLVRRALLFIGPAILMFASADGMKALGFFLALLSCGFVVPGSFAAERRFFKRVDRTLHIQESGKLFRTEHGELFMRAMWINLLCFLLAGSAFFGLDFLLNLLFRYPVMMGRLQDVLPTVAGGDGILELIGEFLKQTFILMTADIRIATAMTAAFLLIVPIGRLAWMLCYLDLRVRRDLWDIELKFANAARQLETTA